MEVGSRWNGGMSYFQGDRKVVVLLPFGSGTRAGVNLQKTLTPGTSGGGKYRPVQRVLKYRCLNDFRSVLRTERKSYRTIIHYVK